MASYQVIDRKTRDVLGDYDSLDAAMAAARKPKQFVNIAVLEDGESINELQIGKDE